MGAIPSKINKCVHIYLVGNSSISLVSFQTLIAAPNSRFFSKQHIASKMRVAIIGAGAAGLTSARHVSAQGFQCDVFEMSPELGGTWVYTDDVGKDKYGYPVHTAMYKGLRANLPKEIMGFPDFPIPEQDESFLPQEDILDFLNLYADHFKLRELIKFNEMVTEVRPLEEKWQIKSIHKPSRQETTNIYDCVMVCNGHYHTPMVPKLPNEANFKGVILHSHQFRSLDTYARQRVLVIGAGPSGLDIALQISSVAQFVVLSYHTAKREITGAYPENLSKKPEVLRIKNEEEVEFVDGSCSAFDTIIHCTGYKYNFRFLHESCGVYVEENHVQNLYKQIVNIERPTMCFIGIPYYVCAFQMFDLQARFYCQYLSGAMTLPSKEIMQKITDQDLQKQIDKGYTKRQAHLLGHHQQEYFTDLAKAANITNIAPVISKIWCACDESFYCDLVDFRKRKYRIINNNTFTTVQ